MTKPLSVACPKCEKQVVWSTDNPHRPFCSERCKLIDFGAWANEEHSIPGEPDLNDLSSDYGDEQY
ncbi:DNA gyrase inhibitor YacG [Thiopseudomonas acetoxidans]|uniref:DNA gyrase inhibitor YacG n=1 Tax=Thiopseudomonas acetoxidans TaxID=3041622 RepID=A0ABT7SRE8_9GAMM|nr:DNA gyrase inhibitor YacG [Thiopseudomonas sp. CY1220]MDM7858773.1 DNA gyrase inhibitor YacG [Thiopseudomonas sp. CY1220]